MALNLGTIYATLSLRSDNFTRQAKSAAENIDRLQRALKSAGREIGQVATGAVAAGGALIAQAARYDAEVARSVGGVKSAFSELAIEIARPFSAALDKLGSGLAKAAGVVRDMSPELKEQVAHYAALGTAIASVAAVGARIAAPLMGALSAVTALAPALLTVAAVLAVVFAAAAFLREAWDENFLGMRDAVSSLFGFISESLPGVVGFFSKAASLIASAWNSAVTRIRKFITDFFSTIFGWLEKLGEALGLNLTGPLHVAEAAVEAVAATVLPTTDEIGEALSGAFEVGARGAKKNLADIGRFVDRLKGVATSALAKLGVNLSAPPVKIGGRATLEEQRRALEEQKERARKLREQIDKDVADIAKSLEELRGTVAGRIAEALLAASDAFADAVRAAQRGAGAEVAKQLIGVARNLGSKIAGRLGAVVDVFESAMQGAALGGGVSGALAAVAADLLTRSKQFSETIAIVDATVQLLADALGELLAPLQPLLAAVYTVVDAIAGALAPVFGLLAAVVQPFVPVLVALAALLEGLAPIFAAVQTAILLITQPLLFVLVPSLRLLFEALKFVGTVALDVAMAISGVWNGVVDAVASVLRTLAAIEIFGAKPFAFLNDWATTVELAKVNTDALAGAQAKLSELTWESAQAAAKETAERIKGTQAQREATEALQNVPTGYKVALRRFQAAAATATAAGASSLGGLRLPGLASGGVVMRPVTAHLAETGRPEAVLPLDRLTPLLAAALESAAPPSINVTIVSNDPEHIWKRLRALMERDAFRARGNPFVTAPPLRG